MKLMFIGAGHVGAALATCLAGGPHRRAGRGAARARTASRRALARARRASPPPRSARPCATPARPPPWRPRSGANEAAPRPIADALAGKAAVDCTNPVDWVSDGLGSARSGSEVVQARRRLLRARREKALTIDGYENLGTTRLFLLRRSGRRMLFLR